MPVGTNRNTFRTNATSGSETSPVCPTFTTGMSVTVGLSVKKGKAVESVGISLIINGTPAPSSAPTASSTGVSSPPLVSVSGFAVEPP